MKSIAIEKEFGVDNLILIETKAPHFGPHDVLVRSEAFSLNYLDLLVAAGMFNNPVPHVVGSDVSGTVLEVGSKVKDFKKGDKVVSHYTQTWQKGLITKDDLESRLGVETGGIFSDHVVLPESSWVSVPHNLSFEEAATLPIAALTAWEAMINLAGIKPGETIYLQGTGGVSIFALQFAKAMGCKTIITSSSDDKIEILKELRANYTINYSKENVADRVNTITDGQGVQVALDVAGSSLGQTLEVMGFKGRVVSVGFLGGATTEVNATSIIQKNLQIRGVQVGSRSSFQEMNRFISEQGIKPVIDKTFDFKGFKKALERLQKGEHIGKIVLNNEWS